MLEGYSIKMSLYCTLALLLYAISTPVIAVELDIVRYRFMKIIHPRTTFVSCMFLIAFVFGLGFAVNNLGVPRTAGIAVFAGMTAIWGVYVHFRTRHMWRPPEG